MFKIGGVVLCIAGGGGVGSTNVLAGSLYVISGGGGEFVSLDEFPGHSYYAWRFVPVGTQTSTVKFVHTKRGFVKCG